MMLRALRVAASNACAPRCRSCTDLGHRLRYVSEIRGVACAPVLTRFHLAGMDNATEWQEVFKTAAKTALILVILDLLRLSKNASWFEEHVDFVSMQAVLFNGAAKSWWQQTRTLVRLQARLTED